MPADQRVDELQTMRSQSLQSAFFCIMGFTPATAIEHEAVAMASLMFGLRMFHRAGEPSVIGRVFAASAKPKLRSKQHW